MILSLLIRFLVGTAKIQGGAGPVLTKPCVGSEFGRAGGAVCRPYSRNSPESRRGGTSGRPPEYAPGALARQSQAQSLDRTECNFCKPRAQWPGGNLEQPLRFCAPKMLCPIQGVPRNGVRADSPCQGEMARRARGGRVGDYEHGVLIGAVPGGVLVNLPCLPAKPSTAGSPGRGGARERAQFSPSGGNGDKRTQGELARRAKRRWPGPLRRRAAMGKGTRRPQAAKFPAENHRSGAPGRRALQKRPPQRAATWGRPYKKKINPKSRWRSNPPASRPAG